jgi:hypothetical protein
MQFTTVFTILAAAMTAAAIPSSRLLARNGDSSGDTNVCSSESTAVCCNGIASCLVNVAAKNCDNSAYCCEAGNDVVQVSTNNLSSYQHIISKRGY